MKKYLFPLALALAMSSGTTAQAESDGPCYDNCKTAYDKCKSVTPTMACYDLYVACVAACDAEAEGGTKPKPKPTVQAP